MTKRTHVPELDGLRGVAILLVFMTHFIGLSLGRPAWLRNPHLRNWGKYSYGLYLIHFPLLGALDWKLGPWFAKAGFWGAIGLKCVVGVPLAYGLAWLSYHAFEKHFLKLKVYFAPSPPAKRYAVGIATGQRMTQPTSLTLTRDDA